jgi:carboxymethylenebutenolidase
MVDLETPDGPMPCYEAFPESGGTHRGMIVIQEAFGVNSHIQELTRRFAEEGYHAVAPPLFHRTGDNPVIPYDRFDEVMKHMAALSDEGILEDIDAVRGHLSDAGIDDGHTGAIGFCMGGRASFLVAARRPLGATVSFYGGGIVTARSPRMPALISEVARIETPWLGLFGDLDESIPVDDVEVLRSALDEHAAVEWDVVRYPYAGHGFHCDQRPSYHEASARDAWHRALGWFDSHLP